MTPRIYLDEDIHPDLALILRSHGYDVVSAHEVPLLGVRDEEQLAYAARQGRAILTFNTRDFEGIAKTWSASGQPHAGILLCYNQRNRRALGAFAGLVELFLQTVTAEEFAGVSLALESFRPSDLLPWPTGLCSGRTMCSKH